VAELDLDRRRGRRDHPSPHVVAERAGQPHRTQPRAHNKDFAATLAKVLKRPALLPIPAFGPRLLLGRELADALLFTGQRVVPTKLTEDGYDFAHPLLPDALRHVLGR
jgi:NAD dependent epimerase/dehydratase family enzyme